MRQLDLSIRNRTLGGFRPPTPIVKSARELFLESIPPFDPTWIPPPKAFTAFSWEHGALLQAYSGVVTPLKDAYLGQGIPQLPYLHVFNIGLINAANNYTRVLEFKIHSDIPQGESNIIFYGTGGVFIRLYGEGGEQRIQNNYLADTDGYLFLNFMRELRYSVSRDNVTGSYHSVLARGYPTYAPIPKKGEVSYPVEGLRPAAIAFDSTNPYATLTSGAQWDWAYRDDKPDDNVYTFDLDTDWLYTRQLTHLYPTISDIDAPPRFEAGVDQNTTVAEPGVFEEGVTV